MAIHNLTPGNDSYVSSLVPTGAETANAIYAFAGNDTVIGNGYVDFIHGGDGHDSLLGAGGDDFLSGDAGNDTLYGGLGDDVLVGGNGNDVLYGNAGNDLLYGGLDNDRYYYTKADGGIDIVNDDKSAAGQPGYGGGTADYVYFTDVAGANLRFYNFGDDLVVTDVADVADGVIDTGVIIEGFFLGGNNKIERVYGSDASYYDTSLWV